MGKNEHGGNKHKSMKSKPIEKKSLACDVMSGEGFYGIIESVVGGAYTAKLHDGTKCTGNIPGKMRNKGGSMRLSKGLYVLLDVNKDFVKIIRETDNGYTEARNMLKVTGAKGFTQDDVYDDNDTKDDDKHKPTKETLKNRVMSRGKARDVGKQFTDPKLLELENDDVPEVTSKQIVQESSDDESDNNSLKLSDDVIEEKLDAYGNIIDDNSDNTDSDEDNKKKKKNKNKK